MKKISRWLAAGLAVVMCLGLAACGKDFDAAGYTKSVLDANYMGEYDDYAKYRNLSKEDAQKEVEDNREMLAARELATLGLSGDEATATYLESVRTIEVLAKYEVKGAEKKDNDNFVVTIEVQPSTVYQTLKQHSVDVAQEMIDAGRDASDPNIIMDLLVESINRSVADNSYGETTTIEIEVASDGDNAYGISDSDMEKIEEALFPQS